MTYHKNYQSNQIKPFFSDGKSEPARYQGPPKADAGVKPAQNTVYNPQTVKQPVADDVFTPSFQTKHPMTKAKEFTHFLADTSIMKAILSEVTAYLVDRDLPSVKEMGKSVLIYQVSSVVSKVLLKHDKVSEIIRNLPGEYSDMSVVVNVLTDLAVKSLLNKMKQPDATDIIQAVVAEMGSREILKQTA